MDAELKAEWLRALRSGEFQQGKGKLRRRGKHCCLGVLCELLPNAKWRGNKIVDESGDRSDKVLTFIQREELDLTLSVCQRLAEMNDDGYDFVDIADYIERKL